MTGVAVEAAPVRIARSDSISRMKLRPIGVRAKAVLIQEVEINIDHGMSNPDSTLPPV